MTISLKTDRSRAGGGFALLEGDGLADVMTIAIEDAGTPGRYLGEDGKWGKVPFAFPVEPAPAGGLSLGPHIVDFVPTDMQLALQAQDGRNLGKLFWADVIPSRNPRSVTSAEVFRKRQQAKVDEEGAHAAALAATEAAKRAEEAADAERRRDAAQHEDTATRQQAEAERKADAERKAEAERKAQAERERRTVQIDPGPPKRRRPALYALLAVLLLAVALGGVLAANPTLLDRFKPAPSPTPQPHVDPPAPTPAPQPPTPTPQPPPAAPAAPVSVDCTAEFSGKLDGLARLSDAEKVALGETALHAGCGGEAFRAFDAADPQSSEATAWYMARFYDPNETDPAFRRAAGVHADYAAGYYRLWRDRSPRQAKALAKVCASSDGGASLRRACGR